jgi:hypothetical protein
MKDKLLNVINNYYGESISNNQKEEICNFLEGYSNAIEEIMKEWSSINRIEEEMDEAVDKAKKSDGYFITVTRKNDNKFTDFQAFADFPLADFVKTMNRHSHLAPAVTVGSTKNTVTGIK